MSPNAPGNFLIVANFPSETGYAWKTIGTYFLSLAQMFSELGGKTLLCYPQVNSIPEPFKDSPIEIIEFDFFANDWIATFRFIKQQKIRTIYFTDRPTFSLKYIVSRLAGVRRIVVHDRTSGHRDAPGPLKKMIKRAIHRFPFFSIDLAIGVSDFVKNRLIKVACLPPSRVIRLHNALDIDKFKPAPDDLLQRQFNLSSATQVIFAHSRANRYKGIQTLIQAAEALVHKQGRRDVAFVYCGDGPDLEYFRGLVKEKHLSEHFFCPGRCRQIERLLRGAAVVVVPSIWQEALGLAVIEGMATAKPVVAARVGGIVEIISDGQDGFLFDPEDSKMLAHKLDMLLSDHNLQKRIGRAARATTVKYWNIRNRQIELNDIFRRRVVDPALDTSSS